MVRIRVFLQAIAVLHIIGGLLLPVLVETLAFNVYHQHLAHAFKLNSSMPAAETRFLVGILGPTIASWGVLFLYTVKTAFSNPNPRAWWFIVIACMVWAPYDSWLSISHGVNLNAYLNLVVLACIAIPMFRVRRSFFAK